MLKAYKFRLNPTTSQISMFEKHIDSCRFVYNWALEQKIKTYEQTGKSISQFDLNKQLTILKKEYNWLKDVNSQSLQGMTRNLESAFTRFFREKNGFPKFKSKKNPVQSFPVPQHYVVDFENSVVKLPKIGEVKAVLHRNFIRKQGGVVHQSLMMSISAKRKDDCMRYLTSKKRHKVMNAKLPGKRN